MSGEHIISAGLFNENQVTVQGFNWCKDEPKIIGLARMTRKILCEKHNNGLSTIDDAAIRAFDAFREAMKIRLVREKLKPHIWNVVRMKLPGTPLERWFAKTLINISYEGEHLIGRTATVAGQPSDDFVRTVFGLSQFKPRAGLYAIAAVGEQINSDDKITFVSHLDESSGRLMGALFYFRGYRLFLYLGEEGLSEYVGAVGTRGERITGGDAAYHLEKMRFMVNGHLSHVVEFKW